MNRLFVFIILIFFVSSASGKEELGRSAIFSIRQTNSTDSCRIMFHYQSVLYDDETIELEFYFELEEGSEPLWGGYAHYSFAYVKDGPGYASQSFAEDEQVSVSVTTWPVIKIGFQDAQGVSDESYFIPQDIADPCGPMEFSYTVINSTRFDQEFALIQPGPDGEWIDTVTIPGYTEHTFNFASEEECESITLYRIADGTIPSHEIETFYPDSSTKPDGPGEIDPPEDDEADNQADYEDTDIADIEDEEDLGEDRKTREVLYLNQRELIDTIKGNGDMSIPDGTGEGDDVAFSGNSGDVLGLGDLLPSMPSVSAPTSAETTFSVNIQIPGTSPVRLDFDLANYSGPISMFRGILAAALTLIFFFLAVKTIREAFA